MSMNPYTYTGPSGAATILDGTSSSHFTASPITNTAVQPDAVVNWTKTNSGKDPFPSGKNLAGVTLELTISCNGADTLADIRTLAGVFDVHDTTLRTLICKDSADSSRQWFIICTPYGVPTNTGKVVRVKLACKSAYWITVATTTESTWNVTSSGATQAFVMSVGNSDVLPVITITPQSAKNVVGGGSVYRRFLTIYNRTRKVAHSYPIDITNGGLNTLALIQDTTVSNQINNGAGYNSAAVTFAIDTSVGGGLATGGGMWYCQRTGEQGSYTAISAGSMTGITRGIGGTVAAALLDNDILVRSKMLANGDDCLVFVGSGNGKLVEVPRWFGDSSTAVINSTATKIWISHNFAVRAQGTLVANINNSVATLTIKNAEGNILTSKGLALVDSEIMPVGSYNVSNNRANALVRGSLGSGAASHTAGATVIFLSQAWLEYGDYTATTPVYSDAQKPTFNLATSTNSSWVYAAFSTQDQTDTSTWSDSFFGTDAITYTADQDYTNLAPVDPVADLGVSIINKLSSAAWNLTVPFGYTSAAFTAVDRYNLPANMAFYKDPDSGNSLAVTASSSNNTWQGGVTQTFTPSATRFNLQLFLKNTRATNFTTRAAVNAGGCTVAMDTTTNSPLKGVPAVTLGSEQAITYPFNINLANAATGEDITLIGKIATGQSLQIDCMNKTMTYLLDNTDMFPSLRPFSARNEWLRLIQGSNTLTYTEVGVTSVNVVISHQDRLNTPA